MLRLFAPIIVAAALLATPAAAATDWGAYGNLSNVKCEDARTIAAIMESAKGLKFANGRRVFNEVSNVKIITSRTVRATRNELVCQLKVRLVDGGAFRTITGRHTVHVYDDGRWRTKFQPNN